MDKLLWVSSLAWLEMRCVEERKSGCIATSLLVLHKPFHRRHLLKMHRKHWYHRRTKITHSHYPLPPCVQNPFNTTTPYTCAGTPSLFPQTTYSARRAPLDSEIIGGRGGLDCTSPSAPTASAAATGEAGDDDVEDRYDAGDDGLKNSADAVDNGHKTGADGLENGLDLAWESAWTFKSVDDRGRDALTQDTTAPILTAGAL